MQLLPVLALTFALNAVTPAPAAKAAFDRAEKSLEANQLDAAVKGYQDALAATPKWAPALNGLGSALFKQNKRDEAISNFKAATEADPGFKLAWFNLGYASRKTNDFATAAQAYEKYTQLDPKDPDGFYGLGESYRQSNNPQKAIAAYEDYVKRETRASETKYVDKAKGFIAELKAAQAAPAAAPVAQPTAQPAAQPVAAAPVAAPAADPIPSAANRRVQDGDKLMGEKKYREASFAYQDAVNADPNNVEALSKLGTAYATLGYYAQAIDRWSKVVQYTNDPNLKSRHQDLIGKAQQKIAQLGGGSPQSQGKPPGSGPVADSTRAAARAWYEQGVKQITGRDYGNALQSLSNCLQLEPALTVGYVARGSALIGLRRFSEAAVDYQYAMKLDPNMAAPMYGLAEAYRGLNRPVDARTWYEKYVQSSASDVRPELQSDARSKLDQLR